MTKMSSNSVNETALTAAAPENESDQTNGKKNDHQDTDLGSAASSANSSGEDSEEEEDEESEDEEIQFKSSRRATRSSTSQAKRSKTSSQAKLNNKKSRSSGSSGSSKKNAKKSTSSPTPTRIRRSSPATSQTGSKPRRSTTSSARRSSITCPLCSDSVEDLNRHLSLSHFKCQLAKLLPSMPPYKCPKCASLEESHDNLICHYGAQHKLNERYLSSSSSVTTPNAPVATLPSTQVTKAARTKTLKLAIEKHAKDGMIECKLCGASLIESQLKDHAYEAHFQREILSVLSKSGPYKCTQCDHEADSFDTLTSHFLNVHDPIEPFISRLVSASPEPPPQPPQPQNGLNDETKAESQEQPQEDVTRPPKEWLVTRPKSYSEFSQQVRTLLRLHDGRNAEPISDVSVKCVCGKVIRCNSKYNWRFLIQRPLLRNGVTTQKGHWFLCSEVSKTGTSVEEWKFSKADIEASKADQDALTKKGCDIEEPATANVGSLRTSRKRGGPLIDEFQDAKRSYKDDDSEDMSDQDDFDEDEEEETPKEQKMIVRRRVNELMATRVPGETFIQDGPCFQMYHEGAMMCHECKYMPLAEKRAILSMEASDSEISCCFYSFRKLKLSKLGQSLIVAGYLDPQRDVQSSQLTIWRESLSAGPAFEDVNKAKFILGLIGDQFCDMVISEQKCLVMHLEAGENKTIVWKPAVKGVREMCDVCKTTIFDHHWTCGRCGVYVCLDCYQFRKGGMIKDQDRGGDTDADGRDEYNWPLCTTGESHQIRKLLLAQIIPKNELVELANKVHSLRRQFGLNQLCHPSQTEFADAFSLQKLAENKLRAGGSPNLSGRPSLMYACRECPGTAFKWQSCLYKHFLINHFNEEIRSQFPISDTPPHKCSLCDYVTSKKYVLLLHIGIKHKVVIKFLEDAQKANGGQSMVVNAKVPIGGAAKTAFKNKSAILTPAAGEKSDKAYDCPLCPLSISHGLRRNHLSKHFYAQLSAEVASATTAPFQCHLCRHVAVDRMSLIKHVGIFHGLVDQYVKQYLPEATITGSSASSLVDSEGSDNRGCETAESLIEPKAEDSPTTTLTSPAAAGSVGHGNLECRLCDRPQFFRHNAEFCRHLSVAHFSQRIWDDEDVIDKHQRPFKCKHCDYTNGSSIQLIIHLGTYHKMAIKYHFEVLNIKDKDWTTADTFASAPRKLAQVSNTSTPASSTAPTATGGIKQRPLPPALPKLEKCPVCGQDQAFPGLLFHLAQNHFAQLLADSRVPVAAPFKCPLCPHFAENYEGMLKHFLIFHKHLDTMTNQVKNPDQSFVPPKADESKALIIRQDFSQKGPFHCLLCDEISCVGQTSYDFHKHLCEVHFRERLLSVITQVETKETNSETNVVTTVRKFRCPVADCGYELPQKWVMAKHYGLKHQIAKQFYANICNVENMPPQELQMQLQHTAAVLKAQQPEQPPQQPIIKPEIFDDNAKLPPMPHNQHVHQQPQPQTVHPYEPPPQYLQPQHQIHPEPPQTYHPMPMDLPPQGSYNLPSMPLPASAAAMAKPSPYLMDTSMSESSILNSSFEDSMSSMTMDPGGQPAHLGPEKNYDCKICAVKSNGMSDYLKHLSKVHFKTKLLSMVAKTAPYKCPVQGCDVVKKDRYNIALHYGMTHKMALKLMQEMPQDAINEDVEAVCKLCHESFTAHRYLYTHLSDTHFVSELEADLPTASPWKCPKCPYVGNDPRALRVHYGVRHKVVLNHLASRLGINATSLKKEMKAGRKKAVSALKATIHCRFCPMQFKSPGDHGKHTVMHLRHVLSAHLPAVEPWKCPRCEFIGATHQALLLHYGGHSEVIDSILESADLSKLNIDMSFVAKPSEAFSQAASEAAPTQNNVHQEVEENKMEDKRFPKCKLCNYRYFTRLDLCRHFVDFHLRQKLESFLDPSTNRCPVCPLTYDKKQSRLRHFIWSHQDLERLVVQDSHVRLSEFMPSMRDLEIVKLKNERNGEVPAEYKDITDLAALPVSDAIDVKLSVPFCELCGEEFKTSVNKSRDKSAHLIGHFREDIMKDLPRSRPFKCPKCTFVGRDSLDLARHYGLNHKAVFIAMQRELGNSWSLSDIETNDCKICGQVVLNSRVLTDHYCTAHFFAQLAEGLPNVAPFKCPSCSFSSKAQMALVKHMGNKHKMVEKLLQERGLQPQVQDQHRRASVSSQDSQIQDPYYHQSQSQQVAQWMDHYNHGNHQQPHQPPVQAQPPPQEYQYPTHPGFASPPSQHHPMQSPHHAYDHYPQPPQQPPQPPAPQSSQMKPTQDSSPKVSTRSDQTPVACPICTSTFLNGTHFLRHAADKHFFDRLKCDLPVSAPFACPLCKQTCKDLKLLIRHYGLNHKMVLKFLNERNGLNDCYDDAILKQYETECNRDCCPLCKSSFGGRYMLLRHLADCHFRERLCQALPQGGVGAEVYKCPAPDCTHESKDKGGFVRHYGLVHKMVQTWLKESGIDFEEADQQGAKKQVMQPPQQFQQPQYHYPPYNEQPQPEYRQPQQPTAQAPPPVQPQPPPQNNQYYSSPPTQYSPHQQPPRPYSNQLMSPSSQASPQNLSSENYISPQGTPAQPQYQAQQHYEQSQYYQQPPAQPQEQQPLDYSNGAYFNHPMNPPTSVAPTYGQQPLTPQTPNPSVTPQPMTPQPMTPGSLEAHTPQPLTPQDQNSNSSTGLMSPGSYGYDSRPPNNYYMQPQPPPAATYASPQYPVQQQQPPAAAPRPVTLQPHDAPRPSSAASNKSTYVPVGDEYIEGPAAGMKGPFAIQCMYCNGISKNKSDFYRHLSERHFKAELAKELPSVAPFKCPMPNCSYETKDNSVGPLIKHYGIVHKSVQKYLRGQTAGRFVHHEAAAKKATSTTPVQLEIKQAPMLANGGGEETTMSNLALKVKCPFCDLMFAARYTFHQHLCDRHFKDMLAEQVPPQPPYLCPVSGCGYVAKDSKQSLVRHYGMTHKVIVDLLKAHAPNYSEDPFNDSGHPNPTPPQHHQPPPQPPVQVQPPPPQQQHHEYYQQPPQAQQQYQEFYPQHPLPNEHYYNLEPQIDGTFDPSHYSDQSSLDGFKSLPTTPIKQEEPAPGPPCSTPSMTASTTSAVGTGSNKAVVARSGPKVCEICGKQFEGKNRAMLKVQHMAQHFKDKLFADLTDKSPPFRCPIEGCQYSTKHKPDWARHYGSVHQFIPKYLKEYLEAHGGTAAPPPVSVEVKNEPPESMETDDEKTYSAYLPKAELSQIISTAMNQQSQPQKNFGVITIQSNAGSAMASDLQPVPEQELPRDIKEEEEELEPQQCFICPNGPWFKNEKELNDHLSNQHIEFVQELKPRLEVLDDIGEVLNDLDIDLNLPASTAASSASTSTQKISLNNRSTGRPCELCGFEPKTKNKSRERQDHLAMKHYRERIQADLTASTNFSCPMCDYVGKDKQTIYRHYTGKHKVVEQYLADDIAAGRVETLAQKQAKEASAETASMMPQHSSSEMKTLPSFEATTLELQNSSSVVGDDGGGLDLSLHGLVDPDTGHRISIAEFLDGNDGETGTIASSGSSASSTDRIMQVDGTSHILQVDGGDDSDLAIPQMDGEEPPEDEEMASYPTTPSASSASGSRGNTPQIESRCPICDFCTKLHKTYHLATQHFKGRLTATLPKKAPFKCPDCDEYEAKTRINLWTHYLGKHRYSKKWVDEWLASNGSTFTNTAATAAPTTMTKLQSILERPPQQPPAATMTSPMDEIKTEIKVEAGEEHVTLPTLAIEEIIKAEMIKPEEVKKEAVEVQAVATPVSTPVKKEDAKTPLTSRRSLEKPEFWCDLCQKVVKQVNKTTHFAAVHFEAKLRRILPTSEPFMCVKCTHVGKDFNKLTTHFLNRHDLLDQWIGQELDIMEDEAIAKSNTFISNIEADLEEVDSDVENEDPVGNGLTSLIQGLYPDQPPPAKKRKVFKVMKDRGLSGLKDFIAPGDGVAQKYGQMFEQNIPTSREPIPVRIMTSLMASKMYPAVPHEWLCDGKLLMLTDPSHEGNVKLFQDQWIRGQPLIVANVHKKLDMNLWRPEAFSAEFGHLFHDIVNTKSGKIVPKVPLKKFWDGFENLSLRMTDEDGMPMLLKLKDWPPDNDLAHTLPSRFQDLMKCIPLKEYTRREGRYNLASFMPDFFARPDLGPKMYIAYGNALYPHTGTTNLHIDMSDACNLMVYVGIPNDGTRQDHIREGLKSVEEADCDAVTKARVRTVNPVIGAIWHIYHPRDADKIRDLLNKVALEKGEKLEPNTDPIHDQCIYLDSRLRKRLYQEYGVTGYAYPQCEGDVVFIPAGAPHQVRNIHNCIKIAEDFVSPENLEWCFYQTEEFRHLSDTHSNHEDKLQIKNILYHSVKECVNLLEKTRNTQQEDLIFSKKVQELEEALQ